MKIVKLLLITCLFFFSNNFLICMSGDEKNIKPQTASSASSDDDTNVKIDIQAADKSDPEEVTKERLDDKTASGADEVANLEQDMVKLQIEDTTVSKAPKRALNLKKKLNKVCNNPEYTKAQIAKEKTQVLILPGLKPENIPTYLLKILLDRKSSLKCIDISPKQTKAFDAQTAGKVTDVIKIIFEKIAEALKSKADKELKRIKIAVDEEKIKALSDKKFLDLPIQVDRKDIEKFKEDPNISSIKFGQFTFYIIPEECKSGWSTTAKIFGVLNFVVMGAGWVWGIYQQATTPNSSTCNCTAINDTTTPAGMFGTY